MATAGSAIGLGNIWRFPHIAGEYGGAAFVLVYVLSSLLISLPIFLCEASIGRKSHSGAYNALEKLAPGTKWKHTGWLTFIASFIIMSYYSVVGGWSLDYFIRSLFGGLSGTAEGGSAAEIFGILSSSTWEPLLMHTLFLMVSLLIITLGVSKGIEKFSKAIIPLLFIIIVGLSVFSCLLPGAGAGVDYLFKPDFSNFTAKSVVYAVGQSFYSMSLGVGCVLVYASYMRKEENLVSAGVWTTAFDFAFAILSGLMVMPAVFAAGLEPSSGPGLVFETFPYIFEQLAIEAPVLSKVVTILFFFTIVMAALTSEISVCEVCASHLSERFRISRKKAIALFFLFAWILGALCCLSFGPLADVKINGQNIFGFCDALSCNVLMPVGALLFCLFVGWKMKRSDVKEQFGRSYKVVFPLVRYVIPPVLLGILVTNFIV